MHIGIDARLIHETGVGRYIRNLIEQVSKYDAKHRYTVYLRATDYAAFHVPNERWNKKIADVRWHTLAEQFLMPFVCLRDSLDLLHVPYFNVPVLYPGKIIVTIHDLTILASNTGKASTLPYWQYFLKRLAYRFVIWCAVKRSVGILTVSHSVKRDIVQTFRTDPDKITVTYEGIDDRIIESHTNQATPEGTFGRYFLYVGNVYPHKNVDTLLEAFSMLIRKTDEDIQLIFAGPEDYFYSKLAFIIRSLDFETRIHIIHSADDRRLSQLYGHAVALVFPSRMEGFGLPALEAIANGCRVIASDIPVFREILKSHAVFSDTTNPESLSRSMKEVLETPFDKKAFQRSVMGYVSAFSWKKMAAETVSAYDRISV